jgi:phenylacetate-CoA ligase
MSDRQAGVFDQRETLGGGARAARQLELLRQTVEICWEHSDFYRSKLEQAGLKPGGVTTLDDLARIPITTKAEAGAARAGLGAFPLHEARRIFVSPGPHYYASQRRSDPSPQRGQTPLALAFHAMGFREGDIVLNTFAYHLAPGGFGVEEQLTAAGCAVVPAGTGNTAVQMQTLKDLPVTGYAGTPSFLKILCDRARDGGLDPKHD